MINIIHNAVAISYNCFKLSIKAIAKEVRELLKDDRFMLSGPVSTLCFTIPN